MTTTRILRAREVTSMTGLSRSSIWRREREGTFPKGVPLGPRSKGWFLDEIQEFVEALHARRDAVAANGDDHDD